MVAERSLDSLRSMQATNATYGETPKPDREDLFAKSRLQPLTTKGTHRQQIFSRHYACELR